jgi:hypothetical protein
MIKELKGQLQQGKLDKEKQDMIIQHNLESIQKKLKDEVEQKMVYQKEA